MAKGRIPVRGLYWAILYCLLGWFAFSAYGAITFLTPAEVAMRYDQRSWKKQDGLPDNRVQAIHQTRDGYLWIATRAGLARFDGTKFRIFNHSTDGIPFEFGPDADYWRILNEDGEGNLLVGTLGGVLFYRNLRFTRFGIEQGINAGRVSAFCPSRQGGVWLAGAYGIALYRNSRFSGFTALDGLAGNDFSALHEDSDGTLWVGNTRDDLQRRDSASGKFNLVFDRNSGMRGSVYAIQNDSERNLCVICSGAAAHG